MNVTPCKGCNNDVIWYFNKDSGQSEPISKYWVSLDPPKGFCSAHCSLKYYTKLLNREPI